MFSLARIKDTVAIHPFQFGLDPIDALTSEINAKYANRVLHDVGLCIAVFDLVDCSEGKVRFGDGCLWHKVTFRMVIFRPFIGEVFVGIVKSCTEESIQVSLGFFDDIWLPARLLPAHTTFDPEERVFFWAPLLEDDPAQEANPLDVPSSERFVIDLGTAIRVCVDSDEFWEDEPTQGGMRKAAADAREGRSGIGEGKEGKPEEGRRAPYTITCAASTSGLGLVDWWREDEAPAEDAGEEEAMDD